MGQGFVFILQRRCVEGDAVPSQNGRELVGALPQLFARVPVGMLRQAFAAGIAEDIGEEHLGVATARLEQDDVGVWIFLAVPIHADLHA